ncbi:carboxy terminal-processing peptidase [Weeksellaceae bacterium KMM 9713]|uniref:Carboxy terminal-processing peptidase n=1 Tax=Profundicola chukchiensis TaxID=2961959 RepID=A0A9X4RWY7_9FLAO|nr:carboxy terminal-processing peptidase [Profundicola chukchiensis]MDG4945119.1 carboxy terminal-processing peptidase [Profundicola chukchiensis]
MQYLRKTYILLAILSMSFLVFCYCSPLQLGDDSKTKEIIKNVRRTLSYLHYSPQDVNDEFSQRVFDGYLQKLDPYKTYFKGKDIESFSQYKNKMDDFFNNEDLTFYHQSIDTLYNRVEELKVLTKEMLKKPLNYNTNDQIIFDSDESTYTKTQAEWEKKWQDRLKYSILQEIVIMEESAKNEEGWAKKDSIGLDKDEFDPRGKSFTQLEAEARKKVNDDMSEFFRRFQKRKKGDWLSIYVNSFTEEFDPHTNYFSPKENEDFELSMSGQLEGIGATLADEKGYPTIKSLVIGGPAWKQGDLEVEDKITKVAQGNKEAVSVVGMLLEDAIRLIRGEKGTTVTLTVQKKDGSFKEIKIVRDIVELEETFARGAVVQDDKGDNYGVIYLPSFYLNYDGKGHDASDDVAREIEELKKSNIKGLVFDVRNNGGGDLSECVEIAGHFINQGPVVQVMRSDGNKKVYDDKGSDVVWDGPMVVLVNELSASASEILAAALQDYDRAIILGSEKTYGKGTVQTVRPLSWFMNSNEEYGMLKFTIQKFYRINGGSTQLEGVASDIVIPDRYSYMDISEGSRDAALPWDQISSLSYDKWPAPWDKKAVVEKSKARIAQLPQVQLVDEYAQYAKKMDDEKIIYLNYEKFRAEYDKREAESKKFEELSKYKNGLNLSSPTYEQALIKNDTILKERRKEWHKNLEKDLYLEESINVLRDMR